MSQPNVVRPLKLQSDGVLIASALAGDDTAFGMLFERHVAHVVRVLARILGSDRDLPDLVNEVFLVVHRGLRRCPTERFRAYLTVLCVNVARNRLRSRRRRSWLTFDDVSVRHAASAVDSSDQREALEATYRLLEKMDDDLRICFSLRFIEGLELTEVGDACGISLATTKRWLQRAEREFLEAATSHPLLAEWVRDGARWGGGGP